MIGSKLPQHKYFKLKLADTGGDKRNLIETTPGTCEDQDYQSSRSGGENEHAELFQG